MDVPGIESTEVGPPPLRRAVAGLLLGLVTGAASAVLLPRDRRPAPAPPVAPQRPDAAPR